MFQFITVFIPFDVPVITASVSEPFSRWLLVTFDHCLATWHEKMAGVTLCISHPRPGIRHFPREPWFLFSESDVYRRCRALGQPASHAPPLHSLDTWRVLLQVQPPRVATICYPRHPLCDRGCKCPGAGIWLSRLWMLCLQRASYHIGRLNANTCCLNLPSGLQEVSKGYT